MSLKRVFTITVYNKTGHVVSFLTTLCTPRGKAVIEKLLTLQSVLKRQHICDEDFNFNLKALLHLVDNWRLLQNTVACIIAIKLKRRQGLHAHFTIIVDEHSA